MDGETIYRVAVSLVLLYLLCWWAGNRFFRWDKRESAPPRQGESRPQEQRPTEKPPSRWAARRTEIKRGILEEAFNGYPGSAATYNTPEEQTQLREWLHEQNEKLNR
jgi:hypothetical protein